jgi:hypothetical protein
VAFGVTICRPDRSNILVKNGKYTTVFGNAVKAALFVLPELFSAVIILLIKQRCDKLAELFFEGVTFE